MKAPCVFCGSTDTKIVVNESPICTECVTNIKNLK